jgi:transposase
VADRHAARTGGHRHHFSHRLYRFYTWCANADIPDIIRLAQTIEDRWPETEGLCPTGITNAKTEGINRLINDVGRRACGFRNPDNQRRRVRHFCTRQLRRSTASHEAMPDQT